MLRSPGRRLARVLHGVWMSRRRLQEHLAPHGHQRRFRLRFLRALLLEEGPRHCQRRDGSRRVRLPPCPAIAILGVDERDPAARILNAPANPLLAVHQGHDVHNAPNTQQRDHVLVAANGWSGLNRYLPLNDVRAKTVVLLVEDVPAVEKRLLLGPCSPLALPQARLPRRRKWRCLKFHTASRRPRRAPRQHLPGATANSGPRRQDGHTH
mmetsp:Transcript_50315/g.150315  ORF Transcript_50315/g.150315 Transcript_50315/m.150315 type:complete len:210 (+) Transcript_50315:107-736(+)